MPFQSSAEVFGALTSPAGYLCEKGDVAIDATAGNVTYTAAELLGGYILRDPAGGARTDVTPTATEILAQIKGPQIGSFFHFILKNTADGNETITLSAGTGVTVTGTATIAQNNTKIFRVVVTAVATPAVVVYSVGTLTH